MSPERFGIRPTPPEVLFIVADAFLGRLGLMIRHLAVGMIDLAVRVSVACSAERVSDDFFGPVRLIRYSFRPRLPGMDGLARLLREVEKQPPDVCFVFGDERRAAREVAREFDCPAVFVAGSTKELRRALAAGCGSRSPLVVLSTPLLEQAMQVAGVEPHSVYLIRPGLHIPERMTRQAVEDVEESAAAPPDTTAILVETPLTHDCGVASVLEAVRRLGVAHGAILLFVVGAGPAEARLRKQCERLGLVQRVTFAGELAAHRIELTGFDVFVQPRVVEDLSLEVLQAMGAGVAVVAAGPGNHDCLIPEETALFYDPASSSSLAGQIERLITDRQFARSLAEAGRQHVRQHHQVSGMTAAYHELQTTLLARC